MWSVVYTRPCCFHA